MLIRGDLATGKMDYLDKKAERVRALSSISSSSSSSSSGTKEKRRTRKRKRRTEAEKAKRKRRRTRKRKRRTEAEKAKRKKAAGARPLARRRKGRSGWILRQRTKSFGEHWRVSGKGWRSWRRRSPWTTRARNCSRPSPCPTWRRRGDSSRNAPTSMPGSPL